MAPPPGTIFYVFITLLTIIIASFKDLSASLMNYSAPPLTIIVAVFDFGQSVKKLNLSAPIYFSSKTPQVPSISALISVVVDYTLPPVAFSTLFISSLSTLPEQKIFLSAKYYVAKSPIGN